MSELKPRITENGIDYILVGDYYIPDLKEHRPIGKYGLGLTQATGSAGGFDYSLYSNTAFIMANARACLLGEVSFQSASISRMVLISFSSSSSCRR